MPDAWDEVRGDGGPDVANLTPMARSIRDRVFGVLQWVRHSSTGDHPKGNLNLVTGSFDSACPADQDKPWWKPLGLSHTPIIVLSSLAPGADTLVVEAALDFAEREREKHRKANPQGAAGTEDCCPILVRAVLPFPEKHYPNASTFGTKGKGKGKKAKRTKKATGAKKARLAHVLQRIREQPGFVEGRDIFHIDLHPDLGGKPKKDLTASDKLPGIPKHKTRRRYLRYRAAGEYIASHSDLLLAVYDKDAGIVGEPENLYCPGVETIVETKRMGLTFGILPGGESFAWADNGPVLHLPISKNPGQGSSTPANKPMAMLHPYDSKPVGKILESKSRSRFRRLRLARVTQADNVQDMSRLKDGDPRWQRSGDRFFRKILVLQEEFNRQPIQPGESEELSKILQASAGCEVCPGFATTESTREYRETLDDMARVRCRAKMISRDLDVRREGLMKNLAQWVLVAAICLCAYEDWDPDGIASVTHPWFVDNLPGFLKVVLLAITIGFLLRSALAFKSYLFSENERRRFDYRAMAESLRIQIAWSAAGVPHSVDAHYMQRQRSEMDWIRYVISALDSPPQFRRRQWAKFTRAERATLLETVRLSWVREQCAYTQGAKQESQGCGTLWHHWGWVLAAAGLMNVIVMFFAELSPKLLWFLNQNPGQITLAGVLLGLIVCLGHANWAENRNRRHGHARPNPGKGFFKWFLSRPQLWGGGLVIGSIVFGLPYLLDPLRS